jgi:hypothetical protein
MCHNEFILFGYCLMKTRNLCVKLCSESNFCSVCVCVLSCGSATRVKLPVTCVPFR